MMETGGSEANAIRMLEMASEPPFLEMKMTVMFDKHNATRLHNELNEVLRAFAEKNGLKLEASSARFGTFEFSKKLKFTVKSKAAADATSSVEKDKFQTYSSKYGYDWKLFGQVVKLAGVEYKVVGVNPRSYRKPVKLERVRDGRGFKCNAAFLKAAA